MKITPFLTKVDIHLIACKDLVAPIADTHSRGVDLITVTQFYTFDGAPHLYRYRGSRTIGETCIKVAFLMRILHTSGEVSPPSHTISTSENRGLY